MPKHVSNINMPNEIIDFFFLLLNQIIYYSRFTWQNKRKIFKNKYNLFPNKTYLEHCNYTQNRIQNIPYSTLLPHISL